ADVGEHRLQVDLAGAVDLRVTPGRSVDGRETRRRGADDVVAGEIETGADRRSGKVVSGPDRVGCIAGDDRIDDGDADESIRINTAAARRAEISGHRRIGEGDSASAGEVNSGAAAGAVI